MSYKFSEYLIPASKYSIKCPYSMTPKYVCFHNTSNTAPAINEAKYMTGNTLATSFHFVCDELNVIQTAPLNRNCFHAGDGANGKGNRYAIGVEVARSTKYNGNEYEQAEENAVYLCARLLYKFGLGIESFKKHEDFSGKHCPHRVLDEGRWNSVKDRVRWVLEEIKKGNIDASLESGTTGLKQTTSKPQTSSNTSSTNNVSSTTKFYRVVAGSFKDYSNSKTTADKVQKLGISTFIKLVNVNGVNYYRVYCGSYANRDNAVEQQKKLAKKSINAFISYE